MLLDYNFVLYFYVYLFVVVEGLLYVSPRNATGGPDVVTRPLVIAADRGVVLVGGGSENLFHYRLFSVVNHFYNSYNSLLSRCQ